MEIGSIFEINPRDVFKTSIEGGGRYPFDKQGEYFYEYFNTGRAAIEALLNYLRTKGHKRVWMPSFNCSSVREAAERANIEVRLYPVNIDLSVKFPDEVQKDDIVYLVQYFGRTLDDELCKKIELVKQEGCVVVEDITLSIFSNKRGKFSIGDYLIGSIRKWLPITDGGFIASQRKLPDFIKCNAANDYALYYFAAQVMKYEYLKQKDIDKQQFLDISNIGMKALFSDYTIREMSEISNRVIASTDFNQIAQLRNENYDTLSSMLSNVSQIKVLVNREEGMCPLGMIIASEERDNLFKFLISKDIYCNIHWRPNDSTEQFEDSKWLSEHCLTLPCDQRYSHEEMGYIANTIKSYYK